MISRSELLQDVVTSILSGVECHTVHSERDSDGAYYAPPRVWADYDEVEASIWDALDNLSDETLQHLLKRPEVPL